MAAFGTILSALLACAADPRPLARQPHAGFAIRDTADGPVVARVAPGPFAHGEPRLRRSDLIVSINGQPGTAAAFAELLEQLAPGDSLEVVVKRGPRSDPDAAIPVGDPEGETLTFRAVLDSRDDWVGTIGRGGPTTAQVHEPVVGAFEPDLIRLARAHELWTSRQGDHRLESLLAYLRSVQADARDAQPTRAVVEAFRRPLSVDRVAAELSTRAAQLVADPGEAAIQRFVADMLLAGLTPVSAAAIDALPPRRELVADAQSLTRRLRDSISLGGPDARAHVRLINRSAAAMTYYALTPATHYSLQGAIESLAPARSNPPLTDLPPELAAAVTGDILAFRRLDDGRYEVAGGGGANTYHLNVVAVIHDFGGDDAYHFHGDERSLAGHVIIDLAGDDRYLSTDDFAGPAVAICGNAIIDDHAGNDVYITTGQCSLAAAVFGVGVLIDRAGDDRYENLGPRSGWSQGAGLYGVGLLIDLAGNDTYAAEKLAQGIGGASGIGLLIDAAGNDTYTADGPSFTSAYKTPGVFLSMSQGFGVGIRGYASGGIGMIHDLAGDDHYRAGEFSQGCGYYFALGLLHDARGDDLYHGNRYSQAAAAHQAVGVLIDDAGNDQYRGMTAASQSGSWDQSITLLLDRAGDDAYTADGLCQGAAAQQALAMFIDLDGADAYAAAGGAAASAQGASGGNEYHHAASGQWSFSLLLDRGRGDDRFSTGRAGVRTTGARHADRPEHSTLWGLFADEPPPSNPVDFP